MRRALAWEADQSLALIAAPSAHWHMAWPGGNRRPLPTKWSLSRSTTPSTEAVGWVTRKSAWEAGHGGAGRRLVSAACVRMAL